MGSEVVSVSVMYREDGVGGLFICLLLAFFLTHECKNLLAGVHWTGLPKKGAESDQGLCLGVIELLSTNSRGYQITYLD